MALKYFLRVTLLLLMSLRCRSIEVRILNPEPVHVIPGTELILRAEVHLLHQERVSQVRWERETETGPSPNRVTVASCTGGQCVSTKPNMSAAVRERELTLQIRGYTGADGGMYGVTVTNQRGNNSRPAQCIVREYEAVHHVSVSINVSHSTLVCGEAWGTEPSFSWLHNGLSVSPAVAQGDSQSVGQSNSPSVARADGQTVGRAGGQIVGRVSSDGTVLYITQRPVCGTFTCVVSNKLGYASDTYTAAECEGAGDRGTVAAVVCLLLLLICGGALGLFFWRKHKRSSNRGERLHEHTDDHI